MQDLTIMTLYERISQLMAFAFVALVRAQPQAWVSCRLDSILPAVSRKAKNLKSLKVPLFCHHAPEGSQY